TRWPRDWSSDVCSSDLVEFAQYQEGLLTAVRLGVLLPVPADVIERAARLAAASDVAIVCVGFGGEWQSEGFDRPDMELPGRQNRSEERRVGKEWSGR